VLVGCAVRKIKEKLRRGIREELGISRN